MNKGENFEFDGRSLDPQDLDHIDFGKNQYGHDYARYYFKTPTDSKEHSFSEKEDFEKFREFAKINDLLGRTDENFEV